MRRLAAILAVSFLLATSGCSLHQWVFEALGSHYSEGGVSREERRLHYQQEVEKWDGYQKYGTTDQP